MESTQADESAQAPEDVAIGQALVPATKAPVSKRLVASIADGFVLAILNILIATIAGLLTSSWSGGRADSMCFF